MGELEDEQPLGRLSLLVGAERVAAGALVPQTSAGTNKSLANIRCVDVQRAAGMLIAIYGAEAISTAKRIRLPGRELFAMMVEREVKARLA